MILVIDDRVWEEYQKAVKAWKTFVEPKPRVHSHFSMSMEHLDVIERMRKAKIDLLSKLRQPESKDRPSLFALADALRARPSTKGPKPSIKDPLAER